MKVVIQKPDLDTCLTALIMNVSEHDQIVIVRGLASAEDLMDPSVLCIEAGGSGSVILNNFDHHESGRYFPPACKQACDVRSCSEKGLRRLVDYVCSVDEAENDLPQIPFPSLSSVFSGMRLTEKETYRQFYLGMNILHRVLIERIDPYATMPDIEGWRLYRQAKEANNNAVEAALRSAEWFTTFAGLRGAWVESKAIGGVHKLYQGGSSIVVMLNPEYGSQPVRKITIAGNNVAVSSLLPLLNSKETGWGGQDKIIGSPRQGTRLSKKTVIELVKRHL